MIKKGLTVMEEGDHNKYMKQSDVNQLVTALLPHLLTKDDLKNFVTKDDIQSISQKLDKLDAKQDDMDIKLDGFLGEILDARETQELQSPILSDHSDRLKDQDQRIKVLEKRQKSNPTPITPLLHDGE